MVFLVKFSFFKIKKSDLKTNTGLSVKFKED